MKEQKFVNNRQYRRKEAREKAKEMAKNMYYSHKGIPRKERRMVCFQIVKEQTQ